MIDDETMISSACGSLALEGLNVPESIKSIMRDCANGTRSFDEAVATIIEQHSKAVNE